MRGMFPIDRDASTVGWANACDLPPQEAVRICYERTPSGDLIRKAWTEFYACQAPDHLIGTHENLPAELLDDLPVQTLKLRPSAKKMSEATERVLAPHTL